MKFQKYDVKTNKILIGIVKSQKDGNITLEQAFFDDNPELKFTITISENDILKQKTDSKVKNTKKWDQFKANEELHGIKSVFDESIYTTPIDKNSEFYKLNVEDAKRIEKEILLDKTSKKKELLDDENKYSTVLDRRYRNRRSRREKTGENGLDDGWPPLADTNMRKSNNTAQLLQTNHSRTMDREYINKHSTNTKPSEPTRRSVECKKTLEKSRSTKYSTITQNKPVKQSINTSNTTRANISETKPNIEKGSSTRKYSYLNQPFTGNENRRSNFTGDSFVNLRQYDGAKTGQSVKTSQTIKMVQNFKTVQISRTGQAAELDENTKSGQAAGISQNNKGPQSSEVVQNIKTSQFKQVSQKIKAGQGNQAVQNIQIDQDTQDVRPVEVIQEKQLGQDAQVSRSIKVPHSTQLAQTINSESDLSQNINPEYEKGNIMKNQIDHMAQESHGPASVPAREIPQAPALSENILNITDQFKHSAKESRWGTARSFLSFLTGKEDFDKLFGR